MSDRVYYIPANTDVPQKERSNFFTALLDEICQAMPDDRGFLKLVNYKMAPQVHSVQQLLQTDNTVFFFGKALGAVVGNLDSSKYRGELDWSDPDRQKSLLFMDQRTGHFWDGVLHKDEYDRFRRDWEESFPTRKFPAQRIAYIAGGHPETADAWDGFSLVYYIPLHRCGGGDWSICAAKLMSEGFLPVLDSAAYRKLTDAPQFWSWLDSFDFSEAGEQPAVQPLDEEAIEAALKYFREIDYNRAMIPRYTNDIFLVNTGSWDLTPYVKYGPDNPPQEDSTVKWLDLRNWNQEIYARDPKENIAGSDEWAAIDFGTKSTSVAIWQNGIHMRRIGLQDNEFDAADDKSAYENPTILCFKNTDAFLAAYRDSHYLSRPDTKFSQIAVAKAAADAFSELLTGDTQNLTIDNMMQFQEQLKQWADDSSRSIYLKYKDNTYHELKYEKLPDDAPDPVEIYAYYIGLYLNNMHYGKIYTKYLLSFSATYFKKNLDRIQQSFLRGLKKSLPAEILADEELMKKFEVRLYLDEATAYAIAAVLRYRTQAAIKENDGWEPKEPEMVDLPKLETYTKAMNGDGLFYGVYDFGGGTLDYSFGYMTRNQGKDIFNPLERGGASNAGCENILEELTFKVFWENQNDMVRHKIPFLAPPTVTDTKNFPLIKSTPIARFNTLQLMNRLRSAWIKNEFRDIRFWLLSEESGKRFDVAIQPPAGPAASGSASVPAPAAGEGKLTFRLTTSISDFFRAEIRAGIQNFLWQFEYTAVKHRQDNADRFIFLGGNASQSPMVLEIFQEKIKAEKATYYLHPALPASYDREAAAKSLDVSYPTAKSGVVHGMLLARPHAPSVQVCHTKLPFRYFKYHLGCWVEDDIMFTAEGFFQLMASASDLRPDVFRYIGQIPLDGGFNLYYTQKPEFGFERKGRDRKRASEASLTTIDLDSCWGGRYLYCRPAAGSDKELELWVSSMQMREITDDQLPETFAGILSFSSTPSFEPVCGEDFDPANQCVRFVQDDEAPSQIYSIRDLPTRNMLNPQYLSAVDHVAFFGPGTGMCIQYGLFSELGQDGTAKKFSIPDGFYTKTKANIYCCRTEVPSACLHLIAYRDGQVVGESRLNLLSKSFR